LGFLSDGFPVLGGQCLDDVADVLPNASTSGDLLAAQDHAAADGAA
jgi:hypothetical protein